MLAKPVPSPTPAGPARSVEWLADAKAASAKGDHLTATAKSQLALTALKQEGRPKKEVLACKELVARSAYKDKNYKVALEHYTGLQKVQPKPAHKKIIGVIRQEAWASQVKPLLAEADQHFANGDYAKARRPAQAARQTAKEFGLDLGPSNRILARVDAAEGAADARSTARRREAYLNEVIEVRVGGAYYDPYGGRLTRMKRREYLRRKAAGE